MAGGEAAAPPAAEHEGLLDGIEPIEQLQGRIGGDR
jgi:hypothetical protein